MYNLSETIETNGWMVSPIVDEIAKYDESIKQYRNINPGEDFRGYERQNARKQ